jgi:hypothetical protein
MARPPTEGPDPRAHRFSRSPPARVGGEVSSYRPPRPPILPVSGRVGGEGTDPHAHRFSRSSPECPDPLAQRFSWSPPAGVGGGKRVSSTGEAGGWMTGWPGVSSLFLCPSLPALRFCVSCVFARCVFLLRCVCCRCAFSSRYGFHSCHAMPGTMPLLRLVRASSRRFPFPFSLDCSDHVLCLVFLFPFVFSFSLTEPVASCKSPVVRRGRGCPVYMSKGRATLLSEGSKRTMD